MQATRPRLALIGLLALVLSATVALSVSAEAKKKGGGKKAVVSKQNIAIPDDPGADAWGRADVLLTVGNKFKGKSVDTVEVTMQTTGSAAGAGADLQAKLRAPNGRTVQLPLPGAPATLQSIGPLTFTPNSNITACSTLPATTCADSDSTLGPPYAGRLGQIGLSQLYGIKMTGDWRFSIFDQVPGNTSVLDRVELVVKPAKPIKA